MVIYSLSIVIVDLIILYGYARESVRLSVRHNSVNLMWHTGNQWSPPNNNFWNNPMPDRAQRYYVTYVSTWTAHSKWCANRFDNCSLYMRPSSATVSWNKCLWRSYWSHLGDASTTYAFCKRCSTHCGNLRQFRQSSPTSRRHSDSGRPSETSFLASLSVGASSISHRPCGGTSSR